MVEPEEILAEALAYAAHGWPVFPCHHPTRTGCSCRKQDCPNVGKHPRTANGFYDATTDPGAIKAWWAKWPHANIGIRAGETSGLLVVDIDPRNGGDDTLAELEVRHGPLPTTPEVLTGGGGRQLYFTYTEAVNVKGLGDGIDVKTEGGYVIAPPSLHATGQRYAWELSAHFGDVPLAVLPEAWTVNGHTQRGPAPVLPDVIPFGRREELLASLAGSMRRRGADESAILAALKATLPRVEQPAGNELGEADLMRLSRSISRYPPAPLIAPEHTRSQLRAGDGELANATTEGIEHLSDLGNAQRLVARFGKDLRYCRPQRCWYVWDGRRWKPDALGDVIAFAKDTVRGIWDEIPHVADSAERLKISRWALASESAKHIMGMVQLAETESGIPVLPSELDSDPWVLNTLSGTIVLRTGKLREHDPTDLITRICPVEYDRGARSELWESYLERVLPDPEIRAFVQRAAGYSLIGQNLEEILFFGYGPARSGKSTFAEALKAALGDYAGTADFASFLKSRDLKGGDRPRGDLVRLAGKRVVTSIEVDEGKSLAEGLVKSLTGRDTQAHRDLFQRGVDTHEVMPSYTLWMMANHRPKVRFEDDAIWERIVLVGFPVHIPEAERDPEVKSRLMDASESGAAVLAWALAGLEDYFSHKSLDPPDSVRASTMAWRTDMDPLKPFLEECCLLGDGAVSYKDLMAAYANWAKTAGVPRFEVLSKAQITPRLKELGCEPRTKEQPNGKATIVGWYGISLVEG